MSCKRTSTNQYYSQQMGLIPYLFYIEEEVMRVIVNICAILSLFAIVVHAGAVIDYNNVEVARGTEGSPDT